MDISQSRLQYTLAATTAYNNAAQKADIKGFRSDTAGQVDYKDEAGNAHSITVLAGEVPPIQGEIEIVNTTAVALLIFL